MQHTPWMRAALLAASMAAPAAAFAQETLTVWWGKGFYKAEDDALFAAIKKFEAKNKNIKIELSQYPIQDTIPKTVAALDSSRARSSSSGIWRSAPQKRMAATAAKATIPYTAVKVMTSLLEGLEAIACSEISVKISCGAGKEATFLL